MNGEITPVKQFAARAGCASSATRSAIVLVVVFIVVVATEADAMAKDGKGLGKDGKRRSREKMSGWNTSMVPGVTGSIVAGWCVGAKRITKKLKVLKSRCILTRCSRSGAFSKTQDRGTKERAERRNEEGEAGRRGTRNTGVV